eukprot:Blabericola_migrator_1__13295@NODE_931_length_5994_cov_125_451324_g647_i0_p3_GENE_NODE_931_length_5994_cov_125_451324_g647_i0NODE_931_length_5994_cov_125_451324_g647_i0_p3_ORF_typecomplete_len216_score17_80Methyltransf_10/PF05971_12/2_3e42MTS/PF05175_14/1_7e14PrmA/PF06325_13/5_7e08Methyltransf_31/PF13847_6/1_6e07UPF0020/PF01170_18/4_3e06Met_10/PF02475_16/1_1e05Methyltransf_25/PF13649_6/2_6e03Methyltransf_25/PF13649_6/6_4e05Methyltransf_23/PF13489_6/3_8e03Methyltransf_23/PF13489_6/3_7e05Methyltra
MNSLKRRREAASSEPKKKARLHIRNRLADIDFKELAAKDDGDLSACFHKGRLDFRNPKTLRALTRATFREIYDINWDLPSGYLISPLPGRLNYLLEAMDILCPPQYKDAEYDWCKNLTVLDVGVGANCIHPLLLVKEFRCRVIGSDIDPTALDIARNTVKLNKLDDKIDVYLQQNADCFFLGLNKPFHMTVCNPPFYECDTVQANPRKVRRKSTP